MLVIYYNEDAESNIAIDEEGKELGINQLKIELSGNMFKMYYLDKVRGEKYRDYDIIDNLSSYYSYCLVTKDNMSNKINHEVKEATCQILELNRLCSGNKGDYYKNVALYGFRTLSQIDTGVISDNLKDIIIKIVSFPKDDILVDVDIDYEFRPLSDLKVRYPRMSLWDNYSLTINNVEFLADRWGNFQKGIIGSDIQLENGKDYLVCKIQKYTANFQGTLSRDVDNEEVFIESSAGLCNTRRVALNNGYAEFRLYPFGYEGKIKIKLGRKWYSVWNDYELNLVL